LVGVLEGAGVGRWLSRLGALGDLTDLGVHLGAVAFALSRQLLPHPEGLRERLLATGVLTLEDLPAGLLTDSGQLELDASGEGLLLLQTECPDLAGLGSGDDSVRELRRKVTLEPLEEFPYLLRYVFALDRAHHMSVVSIPLEQDSQRIQLFFVLLTFEPSRLLLDRVRAAVHLLHLVELDPACRSPDYSRLPHVAVGGVSEEETGAILSPRVLLSMS